MYDPTDELIKEMEKKIAKEYRTAIKEMNAKLYDYARRFRIKDEIKSKAVAAGILKPDDYAKWRAAQIEEMARQHGLIEEYAKVLHNTNEVARSTAQGYQAEAYAANVNYATYLIEKDLEIDTSFTLWDRQTVERLMREEPKLLPDPRPDSETALKIAANKDLKWNVQHLSSALTQSILQGDSVPQIAKRLESVAEMDHKAAIRNARTMVTGAQNAGRDLAYHRAGKMGIKLMRVWIATLDGRTRHEHRMLDGERAKVGEPFKVGDYEIMYPGDPEADPEMVYNCRCTTIGDIEGFELDVVSERAMDPNLGGMTYDQWKADKKAKSRPIDYQEKLGEAMKWNTIKEYKKLVEEING